MFTGIIKEIGEVHRSGKIGDRHRLAIESKSIFKNINVGDSVSIDGACLTVVEKDNNILSFDVVEETIRKTTLRNFKIEDSVNLEDSLKAGDPVAGHYVLGHIDCVGSLTDIIKKGKDISMEVEIPKEFTPLIVQKGSIAIDGISLTVGEVEYNRFKVYIIPHTLKTTTLRLKKIGDEVNLEFDIIGKHVLRLKESEKPAKITEEFLREKGF